MKPIKIKYLEQNKKFTYKTDQGEFLCRKEAERYSELLEMQKHGLIYDLKRYVTIIITEPVFKIRYIKKELKHSSKTYKGKQHIKAGSSLTVNFIYRNKKNKLFLEIVKSNKKEYKDPAYVLKNKFIYYLYRINITEI